MIKKREKYTWEFIITFLISGIVVALSADPLYDLIFFSRLSSGQPLTPIERIVFRYYLMALIYFIMLIIAFIFYFYNKSPIVFIYFFIGITIITELSAWFIIGGGIIPFILLSIATLIIIVILRYEYKHNKEINKMLEKCKKKVMMHKTKKQK